MRFRAGVSEQDKGAAIASHGSRRKKQLRGESGIEKLELIAGQDVEIAALQLRLNPAVEFAEPNFLIRPDDLRSDWRSGRSLPGQVRSSQPPALGVLNPSHPASYFGEYNPNPGTSFSTNPNSAMALAVPQVPGAQPDDPRFSEQWALSNTGQSGGQFGSDIGVSTAWQTTTGSQATVIAVIDSGIDFTHPDLANNKWTNPAPSANGDINGWDYITDTGVVRDEQGHGTAIAGIIAAHGNNSSGIAGVMWRASLMSLRVLDNTGTGDVEDAVEAIDYAAAHGAQVINISWGTSGESIALKDAIERAIRRGVVVVCSAGNNGQDVEQTPYYPASFNIRDLIAVASTDNFDQLASWSNWGRRSITVAAPGISVLTTQMSGGYWLTTGTSASAPLVSGVAGLLKTVRPGLNSQSVKRAIADGSRQVASLTGKVASKGVISASGSLTALHGNGGNGNGNGNGGPRITPSPPPLPPRGGPGPGGSFSTTPPPTTSGAPGPNLPNLDQLRNARPEEPKAQAPIQSNLVCADCDPQGGGGGGGYYPANDPNFSTARLRPVNQAGQEGVDLGSRNFNWSLPLVSLPGRAGLNVDLSLFYNSLVWTKDGSYIKYNADLGSPAPGFSLGLPKLQQQFMDSQTGGAAYLMVTPSGGRVELRQQGLGVFEAADGSNTQLLEGTYYSISARHSGKCLDVFGWSQDNGGSVLQWDCNNYGNQQWQLVPTDSGYYRILARHSGKAMDVSGGSYTNGAYINQWDYVGGWNQQWQLVATDSGYYRIVARHSGKVLEVQGSSTATGAIIQQWDYLGGSHQQWRLAPAENVTVRSANGTQLTFTRVTINNEYRCTQIKDRHGNYISATFDMTNGHLQTITDTLGRVISFIYDGNSNLSAIRQTWAGVAHDWATFNYGEVAVAPSFGGGLLVNGPSNNNVTVLTRVNLHDGSSFRFDYNAAFGQVKQINHFAADNHKLAHTSYNVNSSAGQEECPRFTERRDWAENWNGGVEAVTTYATDDNSWSQQTTPDGTMYKEVFYTTGWRKGLTEKTEVWFNNVKQKWTETVWTQDDENLSYQKNPRPTETKIYDVAGNYRRTTISYGTYNLPFEVTEYAANGVDVLRRTQTYYQLGSAYVDRRLIGLPDLKLVYDGAGNLAAKSHFSYDWGVHLDDLPGATQHDDVSYSKAALVTGRGNLTMLQRFNVNDPNNAQGTAVEFKWSHNTTGQVTLTRDMNWHQTFIYYNDAFSDGVNRNTFAYPTRMTDGDGYDSYAKYNFDYSAVTWRQTPSPNSGQTAPTETFSYDTAARIQQVTNGVNGAYTQWVYPTSQNIVQTYTTVVSGAGTAYAAQLFDGAGRVRALASDHPYSNGGFSGQYIVYDNMGRAVQQSNPTEMTSIWNAVGDDSAWIYTIQAYDWQGRPTVTTNADGSQRENIYSGCGCAGGEQVTARDEASRRRRMTMDVLGRLSKTEELNYDLSVYSTTTYSYNARDQLTQMSQQGQVRTLEYDGHGRLWKRTTPEQGQTEYDYNSDDTVNWVKEARGSKTIFGYNGRHLPTAISYDLSGVIQGQSVSPTTNVTFGYDDAGNRTSMTDALGSVSYGYDQLSRLTSETRTFTGVSGTFPLTYQYNLAGGLTRITNPWTVEVGYSHDRIGRVNGVTGSGYAGITSYINDIRYRAFGAAKQVNYSNGRVLSLQYNNRMFLSRWDLPNPGGGSNFSNALGYTYDYNRYGENNTGRVTFAHGLYDSTLDRSNYYDQVGRLAVVYTGSEARATIGTDTWGHPDGPYAQIYGYDVFGNRNHREGWGGIYGSYTNDSPSFTNNQQTGLSYDFAGNPTAGGVMTYDATGQQIASSASLTNAYNGDRLRGKKTESSVSTYYLRSSVLGGQVVCEINASAGWNRGYVYLGGQLLAIQSGGVNWVHQEPTTKGQRITNSSGSVSALLEVDPFGGEIGSWASGTRSTFNTQQQPHKYTSYERDANGGDDAMMRRYGATASRFDQPDPYDGSYNFSDPQSFNRYAYVNNDPVNFVDPTGLDGHDVLDPNIGGPPPASVTIGISLDSPVRGGSLSSLAGLVGGDGSVLDEGIPQVDIGGGPQHPLVPESRPFGPCAGKKGADLKYDEPRKPDRDGAKTAREHITNNHINQLPRHRGKKSVYLFDRGVNWTPQSTDLKQAIVGSLNAVTFNMGVGVPIGDRYVFVFDFNAFSPMMGGGEAVVGREFRPFGGGRGLTGVNTLVVEKDCQTTVTSYPGVP